MRVLMNIKLVCVFIIFENVISCVRQKNVSSSEQNAHLLHLFFIAQSISLMLFLGLLIVVFVNRIESTPLDDYVRAPDSHFNWTVIQTYNEPDYVLYILNFTSQKWFDGMSIDGPFILIRCLSKFRNIFYSSDLVALFVYHSSPSTDATEFGFYAYRWFE